jgi:hypothetical protein
VRRRDARRPAEAEDRDERREPAAPAPAADVLALQRTAGNQAVAAAILARKTAEAAPLPPIADNLRRFRAGFPRLQALAGREPPVVASAGSVDLTPALQWLTELVDTLALVEPIVDPSMLVFESIVVEGHDAEYGNAETQIRPQLAATLRAVIPIARTTGDSVGRVVMEEINNSSVAVAGHGAEPQVAPLADVTAWRQKASALRALAKTVDPKGTGLAEAAHACEDAALALLQARSVLEARAMWRADDAQSATPAQIANPKRRRSAVDDIFADAGFGSRQSLREDGTRDDWCGMFVAASMFRGAALDKNMRKAFAHTDNVYDFFNYTAKVNDERTPLSIWAEDRWWSVKEYHAQRGLPRTWTPGAQVADGDIRPGDVALIRHKGTKPDKSIANHIVMVDSWDPATGKLVTIEGNVLEGVRPGADGEPQTLADGTTVRSTTTTAPSSTAIHVRDMNDARTLTPGAGKHGEYQERGARTVFGVGRPSLVDFEQHLFGMQAIPEKYTYTSPDEMRRLGQGKRLQAENNLRAP